MYQTLELLILLVGLSEHLLQLTLKGGLEIIYLFLKVLDFLLIIAPVVLDDILESLNLSLQIQNL